MTPDDILKLKAVALYVINRCGRIDFFHLFKIIYFADREHYATYGRRIVQDTFCAMKDGPVPSNLYNATKDANGTEPLSDTHPLKVISKALEVSDPTYYYIFSASEVADLDELSQSDIRCLNKSIDENLTLQYDDLSEKSHKEAWNEAIKRGKNSEIDPILMAHEAGASEATLELIRELEDFR